MNTEKNYSFAPVNSDIQCFHSTEWDYLNQVRYCHRHDAYEIYLFIQGDADMSVEQVYYHLEPGDLIVLSPSEMHRVYCLKECLYERVFINVKEPVVDRLSTRQTNLSTCFTSHPFGQRNLVHLSGEQMKDYIELAYKLQQALSSNEYGQDILADSYLSQILVFVNLMYTGSNYTVMNSMPELVRETMIYIEEHINETVTLEQLSRKFYLSGTYISRQFKKNTGLSLRKYILDQKITLAKSFLSEGKNVSEACYLSGFSDYANFIRSFTKTVGVTPGHMKKSKITDTLSMNTPTAKDRQKKKSIRSSSEC